MSIEQTILWAALIISIGGAVYGLAQTIRTRPEGQIARPARGFFVWPNTVSVVLAALAVLVVAMSGRVPSGSLGGILGALAIGWALVFLMFFASRSAGRKLASQAAGAEQGRVGYWLLSSSGFLVCSAVILGPAIMLLMGPVVEPPIVGVLLVLALGFWLAATYWSLPSAIYRTLLAQDADADPADVATICVQFRSVAGEMAVLAGAALVVAAGMGAYHYEELDISALVYPVGAFAASLLFGLLASPLIAPGRPRALRWLGVTVFLAGTGFVAWYLNERTLMVDQAFWSFGIGLVTAMLLILLARYRPPFVSVGSPFGLEIAVAQAVMVLAAVVMAFRWKAGFGVGLCGVGLVSSFPILLPLGALWAASRDEESEQTDLSFMTHAASRFAEIVMAGTAFVAVVGILRLYAERAGLGRTGIDITEPYPLIGLVIGGSFPLILRALSLSGKTGVRAATFDRTMLTRLGRWAAFRSLGIWLLVGITPMLVAFFWRGEAAGAFLVGLVAAELFLVLTLWLGEVRNTADEGIRLATRSTHVLAVGSGLITALLAPSLIEATGAITRMNKIYALIAVLAVVFVWAFVVVWRRIRS